MVNFAYGLLIYTIGILVLTYVCIRILSYDDGRVDSSYIEDMFYVYLGLCELCPNSYSMVFNEECDLIVIVHKNIATTQISSLGNISVYDLNSHDTEVIYVRRGQELNRFKGWFRRIVSSNIIQNKE